MLSSIFSPADPAPAAPAIDVDVDNKTPLPAASASGMPAGATSRAQSETDVDELPAKQQDLKMGMKPMLLIGVAVLGLGLLLHIVGMATPAWSTASVSNSFGVGTIDHESGPWKICVNDVCSDWTTTPGKVEAVQAMTMIGVLAGAVSAGAAILLVVLSLLGKDQIKILPLAAAGADAIAFVFILLGVIIWGAAIHADFPEGYDIGYSFALSLLGGIGIAVGGVLVYLSSETTAKGTGLAKTAGKEDPVELESSQGRAHSDMV